MIFVDTREQKNSHIIKHFDKVGLVRDVDYMIQACDFGDYYSTSTGIAVERKKDLIEFAGNCGKNHARFKRELEKLDTANGKMTILIEQDIKLAQMVSWNDPKGKVKFKVLKSGKLKTIKPMNGLQMFHIVKEWLKKHPGLSIAFCNKENSGKRILEILKGE